MKLKDINLQSNDYLGNDLLADVIGRFCENQTMSSLQDVVNCGIGLKILKNNKWERNTMYELPFERFVLLYDDNFQISDLGIY